MRHTSRVVLKPVNGQFPSLSTALYRMPEPPLQDLLRQCQILPLSQQRTAGSMAITLRYRDCPLLCPPWHHPGHQCGGGGLVGRMMGRVKRCFHKILGESLVNAEQMSIILIGVEAALNSRPLVHNYHIEEPEAFTPSHFLVGKRITDLPEPNNHPPLHDLVRVATPTVNHQELLEMMAERTSA
ncbi:uncharacterized protein LOC111621099 [Centruroides sculpturatus]|uniref:uncharacterized protein LOC111621099 n=1 Tax=Centruroides sculpturatus TaxID=218467 RepID=UPI000C6DA47C|nr:uncharacterized protein LOC111621099 [Centruroides sculpturatus]